MSKFVGGVPPRTTFLPSFHFNEFESPQGLLLERSAQQRPTAESPAPFHHDPTSPGRRLGSAIPLLIPHFWVDVLLKFLNHSAHINVWMSLCRLFRPNISRVLR